MIERHIHNHLIWIDLVGPTTDDVHQIMSEFGVPPELLNDLTEPVPRSEAVCAGGTIKITLDFPIVRRTDMKGPHEVKFLITKEALITVRYEEISAFDKFKKELGVLEALHRTSKNITGADLFVSLMHELYNSIATKLDYIQTQLSDIEATIFDGKERDMVFKISEISRRLISFKESLHAHDDVLRDVKRHFENVYKKKYIDKLEDLHVHYFHRERRTLALFEILEDFRNTNQELLTTKQNEVMKTLTIMAFITFPLTLLTSMFGMNTIHTHVVGSDGDFWIILGFMSYATIGFFIFFKSKNWM